MQDDKHQMNPPQPEKFGEEQDDKHQMDEPKPEKSDGKTKKKKGKTLLETMREVDAKEAKREAEWEEQQREALARKKKEEQAAYDKRIRQERIELLRMKQGLEPQDASFLETKTEKPKLSLWRRIYNFFYANIWWLGITSFLVVLFGYLALDLILRVRPDMIVLLLTDDAELQLMDEELEAYFEAFTDDENGDGRVKVTIYAIPVTDDIAERDYYTGNATKLSTQLTRADSVMVLTDAKANKYIDAEDILVDLTDLYPDDEHVREQGYYLRHTDFATKIGYPGNVDRDLSLGLRQVRETYDSRAQMQDNYEIAKKVLDRVVASLAGTEEPADSTAETEAAEPAT